MDEYEKVEHGIIEWNRSRGNTTFNLDLEMNMLLEEAQEYFKANSIIDRIDAYLDFQFVAIGTKWKHGENKVIEDIVFDFMDNTGFMMGCDLEDRFEKLNFPMRHYFNFINDGLAIVLKYNNKKSSMKDKNGKIVKPVNFVGPEKELEKLFNEYMKKG